MTHAVAERTGVRHLGVLAQCPRPAGGRAEFEARAYAVRTLAGLGFLVREEHFTYSTFPGRFATPIAGGILSVAIAASCGFGLAGRGMSTIACTLAGGVLLTAIFARWMLGGVLTIPWSRANGVNLVATRGPSEPRVWLVAHLDSKSQPVPSLARVAGVLLLVLALAFASASTVLTLFGVDTRTLWWAALVTCVIGALPVVASVVGARSDGAVDNASGVAAVLTAAVLLNADAACGVLLSTAEELGLAGARDWASRRAVGTALNCDGVDDGGNLVILYNKRLPLEVVDAVRTAASRPAKVRRMPLGLLTDSTALAHAGWRAVTVSHGSLATLRRVHTSNDSVAMLRGTAIDDVADILARAAEALAS